MKFLFSLNSPSVILPDPSNRKTRSTCCFVQSADKLNIYSTNIRHRKKIGFVKHQWEMSAKCRTDYGTVSLSKNQNYIGGSHGKVKTLHIATTVV